MNEDKCPFCANHCLKENLGCGRGRNYFNKQNDNTKLKENKNIEDNNSNLIKRRK